MKFKNRCAKCGHSMLSLAFPKTVVVHSCLGCHRVMVIGHSAGDIAVGDMFDAQMKARGYHRVL